MKFLDLETKIKIVDNIILNLDIFHDFSITSVNYL